MTNDGEVFCVHDMNLRRTFGIAGLATNVCWKGTLDKVDVGAIKGPQFAGRADCRVPRVDEVFALIPDDGRKITLEVKDPRPEIVPLIQAAWRRHPNMKEENIIFLAHKATRAALVKAFPRATFQHCVNCYSDRPAARRAGRPPGMPELLADVRPRPADARLHLGRPRARRHVLHLVRRPSRGRGRGVRARSGRHLLELSRGALGRSEGDLRWCRGARWHLPAGCENGKLAAV